MATNSYYNRWSYLSAALFAIVFIGLFFGRAMQRFVNNSSTTTLCIIAAACIAVIWQLTNRHNHKLRHDIFSTLGVLISTAIYLTLAVATYLYVAHKIEIVHFLQFSLLAIFTLFAWATAQTQLTTKLTIRAAILAALFSLVVGATEEYLQLYVPQRFYDPRDIILNTIAAAIGATLGFLCLKRN